MNRNRKLTAATTALGRRLRQQGGDTRSSRTNGKPSAARRGVITAVAGIVAVNVVARAARRHRSMAGQVAIVTGGSRGLGLALGQQLVKAGCKIVLAARDENELRTAAQTLTARGGTVLPVVCDVSDTAQAAMLVERTLDAFGAVDLVINNAGVIQVGPLEAMTIREFREAMDPMFWGTVNVTLAVLPDMRRRRSGHIVNITSIGGKLSVPHLLPYSSAKFAAVGFSEGLRAEVARDRITVTTVVPGLMRTGSDMRARFGGATGREFGWFAIGAAVPGLSMRADRAAGRIVQAIRAHRGHVVLTAPAKMAVLAHGMFPSTTQVALTLVNRLLPKPAGANQGAATPGTVAAGAAPDTVVAATELNRRAGDSLNQPRPA